MAAMRNAQTVTRPKSTTLGKDANVRIVRKRETRGTFGRVASVHNAKRYGMIGMHGAVANVRHAARSETKAIVSQDVSALNVAQHDTSGKVLS